MQPNSLKYTENILHLMLFDINKGGDKLCKIVLPSPYSQSLQNVKPIKPASSSNILLTLLLLMFIQDKTLISVTTRSACRLLLGFAVAGLVKYTAKLIIV